MKKIFIFLFSIIGFSSFAQNPVSFDLDYGVLPPLVTYQTKILDMEKIELEDIKIMEEQGVENIGRVVYDNMTTENSGTWTNLADGSKIWRLKYKTQGAQGTSVYFNNYHIPEGGEVYLYTEDKTFFVGPFGSEENNDHGKYVTDLVPSATAILEYYQPADVIGEATLDIMGFGHFYQGVYEANEQDSDKSSDPCEVDVNCPEGDGWENERDAVVRLLITSNGSLFYCSGTMVNNTAQDCKQYLLTALHCLNGVSDDDLLLLKVRFNYERSGCGSGSTQTSHIRTGAFHRADSNGGGGVNGSDFALVEVEDPISTFWNIYFAGWDSGTASTPNGVCIHHPAGDRKKISTFTSPLTSATYQNAFGAHWRVIWASTVTNHGVTEGGSSGSPIFNSDHQIVGTLTGGASFCDSPNDPDFYGKMSYHWTGNPNPENQKLKVWLDPLNTGQATLDGLDDLVCESVDINELQFKDIFLYPNPTNGKVNINFSDREINNIKVFNSIGIMVLNKEINNTFYELDLENFPKGVYYLTFTSENQYQLTKKLTKL